MVNGTHSWEPIGAISALIAGRVRHIAVASRADESTPAALHLRFALPCRLAAAVLHRETAGERLADMPQWMGGMPAGVPPRRGTPEYDASMAARAQEAARPRADQPK